VTRWTRWPGATWWWTSPTPAWSCPTCTGACCTTWIVVSARPGSPRNAWTRCAAGWPSTRPCASWWCELLRRRHLDDALRRPGRSVLRLRRGHRVAHANKADAPSGTALRTASMIAAARAAGGLGAPPDANRVVPAGRARRQRGRRARPLGCGSGRPGGPPGGALRRTGETLTIRHDSLDRSSFMPGVLLAARGSVPCRPASPSASRASSGSRNPRSHNLRSGVRSEACAEASRPSARRTPSRSPTTTSGRRPAVRQEDQRFPRPRQPQRRSLRPRGRRRSRGHRRPSRPAPGSLRRQSQLGHGSWSQRVSPVQRVVRGLDLTRDTATRRLRPGEAGRRRLVVGESRRPSGAGLSPTTTWPRPEAAGTPCRADEADPVMARPARSARRGPRSGRRRRTRPGLTRLLPAGARAGRRPRRPPGRGPRRRPAR